MIQSRITTPITLISNESPVAFQNDCIRTGNAKQCNACSWLCHSEANPLYKITRGGLYHVEFNANVSSTTAGVVAFGLFLDGIQVAEAIETISGAGDYANISIDKTVPICQSGTLTIEAIPSVINPNDLTAPVPVETQVPIIISANLQIRKEC